MAKTPGQVEAGHAQVRISLDNKQFRAGLYNTSRLLNRYGAMLSKVGTIGMGVGGAMVGAFGVLTKQVADLETQFKRFSLIFADLSGTIRKELNAISDETGVPMSTLVKEASAFGAVFAEMREELSDPQFAKVISNTMRAMLDLAAVGGLSLEEAAERLKSGFTSTGESVDQFGYNLRKANLEAEAARLGITKSILTMSEQEKQLLKLNIMMRQSSRTGINFVEMVDTINGQLTLMQANMVELVYRAGWAIQKAVMPMLRAFNRLLIVLRPVAAILSPFLVIIGAIGANLGAVGGSIFALGVILRFMAFALRGFATVGLDLKQLIRLIAYLPTFAGAAKVAIIGLAAAFAKLASSLWGVLYMLPLILKILRGIPAALAGLAAAHPIGAVLTGGLAGITAARWLERQAAPATGKLKWAEKLMPNLFGIFGGDPIRMARGAYNVGGRLQDWLFGTNSTPVAEAIKQQAMAFSTAGAFGGNIAQRLAYGPSVGAAEQTTGLLQQIYEGLNRVTTEDSVRTTSALN